LFLREFFLRKSGGFCQEHFLWKIAPEQRLKSSDGFSEIALVLVHFDHVASVIVNANQGIM